MTSAQKVSGRLLLPWLPARWGSDLKALKEIVARGDIGRIYRIHRVILPGQGRRRRVPLRIQDRGRGNDGRRQYIRRRIRDLPSHIARVLRGEGELFRPPPTTRSSCRACLTRRVCRRVSDRLYTCGDMRVTAAMIYTSDDSDDIMELKGLVDKWTSRPILTTSRREFRPKSKKSSRLTGRTSRGAISPARYSDRAARKNPARIEMEAGLRQRRVPRPRADDLLAAEKRVRHARVGQRTALVGAARTTATGIIPSMFGAEILSLPDSANMLPGAMPLPDDRHLIDRPDRN